MTGRRSYSQYLFEKDAISALVAHAEAEKPLLVTALNVNILYNIQHSLSFQKTFLEFNKITFDGYYSIVWARAVGVKQKVEQISADFLMKQVFADAADKGWSICVLGGTPETEMEFRTQVQKEYPGIDIAFHQHGYFREDQEYEIIEKLNSFSPDILLVGLSVPKEHEWVVRNKDRLNARVVITCGGYIEQTSHHGIDYYPSHWIYKLHLNWIYRIYKEPGRLWRRYFFQGLWFLTWLPGQFFKARILGKNILP